jgi:hypothetical protein
MISNRTERQARRPSTPEPFTCSPIRRRRSAKLFDVAEAHDRADVIVKAVDGADPLLSPFAHRPGARPISEN